MVENGQKVFISSGSTTYCLARALDNTRQLIVVTDAINIASELLTRTNISVISVGGELRKNTFSCVGYFAEEMIKQLKCHIAFLGICGIGENGELYSASALEIGIYRAILQSSKKLVILADFSKIGNDDFACIGNLKDVHCLITDSKAPKNLLSKYAEMGVEIKVADVGG